MSEWLPIINAIDINHDNKISSKQEVQKARQLGINAEEGEPIENKMVTRAIETAQKRVEGHHFEIRKTLLDYDNVMNQQREVIYELRHDLMTAEDTEPVINDYLDELLDEAYAPLADSKNATDENKESVRSYLRDVMNLDKSLPEDAPLPDKSEAKELVKNIFDNLKAQTGEIYKDLLRYFLLEELDRCWKEHLRNMDALRDGIGLRGYGQRDPKLEYKREGFEMFQELLVRIKEGAFRTLTRVQIQPTEQGEAAAIAVPSEALGDESQSDTSVEETSVQTPPSSEPKEELAPEKTPSAQPQLKHHSDTDLSYSASNMPDTPKVNNSQRIGRNDPCPCGSGKKYKKCCGANK